jgi:hypothetical protein
MMAVAAQNYGQNSYRIRRPFDFTGRTGTIVFDAEGFVVSGLLGWISLDVTEDPTPVPSYSIGTPKQANDEGGAVPRNGFEIHFRDQCNGSPAPAVTVSMIDVLTNYQDNVLKPNKQTCINTQEGKLNHFEVRVSKQRIEVYGSPFSDDGVHFAPVQLLFDTDVNLPFERGYVQITTHNHATIKYSQPTSGFGATHVYDAWVTRWDNVGFDGPVVDNWREYEIPDSLVPGHDAWNLSGPDVNVGYRVADAANGPNPALTFKAVDLAGAVRARLAIESWYLLSEAPNDQFVLEVRLNGGAWRDRPFTPGELAVLSNGHAQGQMGQMIDIPLTDLIEGDNTLELQTKNVPQNYPPAVASIDLILETQ